MDWFNTNDLKAMNKIDLVDLLHEVTGESKRNLRRQPKGELMAEAIRIKQTK